MGLSTTYHDGKSLSADAERQDLQSVRDQHRCVGDVIEEVEEETTQAVEALKEAVEEATEETEEK